ncbi:MAG: CHAT domain-containing protein, partial [Myxococcales bacterium]|nr:CHAT domain-containing protein [Myxococcales bacterium]
ANAAELYALPWELLTLPGSDQHIGTLDGLVLNFEWPETETAAPSRAPRPEGGRILFAWSAAAGAIPVAEQRALLLDACTKGHPDGAAGLEELAHASLAAIRQRLAEAARAGEPFAVLHILCHGGRVGSVYGLILDEEEGEAVVDPGRLRQTLAPFAGDLRLIALSACDSSNSGAMGGHLGSAAQTLHQVGFAAVVSSRYPLSTAGSVRFYAAFYAALLGDLRSVERASAAARSALLDLEGPLDWASVQLYTRVADGRDNRPIVVRPYRGLRPYDARHPALFAGRAPEREEARRDLEALIAGGSPRLLILTGAAASGATSLLRAGVVPDVTGDRALRQALARRLGRAELDAFAVIDLTIADDPLTSLEGQIADAPADAPLLVAVDGLERLFTRLAEAAAREAFARRLWAIAGDARGSICVATLRVDYIGRCAELPLDDAGATLEQIAYAAEHRIFVRTPAADALRTMMEAPARRLGLRLQEGLCERLLGDLCGDPQALPHLSQVLDILWSERRGQTLTLAAFTALGGVGGALQRQVEAILRHLSEGPDKRAQAVEAAAHRLFTRMIRIGEDDVLHARRAVAMRDLLPPEERAGVLPRRPPGEPAPTPLDPEIRAHTEALLERLCDARLLTRTGDDDDATVSLGHAAILRGWRRLRAWVKEDQARLAAIATLDDYVDEWRRHRTLLSGSQLGYALEIERAHGDALDADTRELIGRSRRADVRRALLRRVAILGALASAVLTATFAVWYGIAAREAKRSEFQADILRRLTEVEREQARLAERETSRALAVAEVRRLLDMVDTNEPENFIRDLLVAREAQARGHALPEVAVEVHEKLLSRVLQATPHVRLEHGAAVRRLRFAADGALATAGADGAIRLWSAAASTPTRELLGPAQAIADLDLDDATIAAIDVTGALWIWPTAGAPATPDLDDARFAAVRVVDGEIAALTSAGELRRYDPRGALLDAHPGPAPTGPRPIDAALEVLPDGALLGALAPGPIVRFDLRRGRGHRLIDLGDDVIALIRGAAAGTLGLLRDDRSADLWRADMPSVTRTVRLPFAGDFRVMSAILPPVPPIAMQPGAPCVAISEGPGEVLLRCEDGQRTSRRALIRAPSSESAYATALRFDDAGERLAVATSDGLIALWELGPPGGSMQPALAVLLRGHEASVTDLAFDRRGRVLASASEDGTARLWSTERGAGLTSTHTSVGHLAMQLRGEGLSIAEARGDQTVVTALKLAELARPPVVIDGERPPEGAAFSPDGARVLIRDADAARLVTLETRAVDQVFAGHRGPLVDASFAGDGRHVLTASADGELRRWPTTGGQPTALDGPDDLIAARLTYAGRWIVSRHRGGELRIWPATGDRQPALARSPRSPKLALSPSDERLAFSDDARVVILDLRDEAPRETVLTPDVAVSALAFAPTGDDLIIALADGQIILWSLGQNRARATVAGDAAAVEVAVDRDLKVLLVRSADGDLRGWSLGEAPRPYHLTRALVSELRSRLNHAQLVEFAFSDDGALVVARDAAEVRIWPLAQETLSDLSCAIAGRELRDDELTRIFPTGDPPQARCDDALQAPSLWARVTEDTR